jgi:hypothetical protein
MERFCDNPWCYQHQFPKDEETEVLLGDKRLIFSSHKVNGVNFCSTCLHAIKLSMGESLTAVKSTRRSKLTGGD